jgi:hypothetical protein
VAGGRKAVTATMRLEMATKTVDNGNRDSSQGYEGKKESTFDRKEC